MGGPEIWTGLVFNTVLLKRFTCDIEPLIGFTDLHQISSGVLSAYVTGPLLSLKEDQIYRLRFDFGVGFER
jgi:hypothetical protein